MMMTKNFYHATRPVPSMHDMLIALLLHVTLAVPPTPAVSSADRPGRRRRSRRHLGAVRRRHRRAPRAVRLGARRRHGADRRRRRDRARSDRARRRGAARSAPSRSRPTATPAPRHHGVPDRHRAVHGRRARRSARPRREWPARSARRSSAACWGACSPTRSATSCCDRRSTPTDGLMRSLQFAGDLVGAVAPTVSR